MIAKGPQDVFKVRRQEGIFVAAPEIIENPKHAEELNSKHIILSNANFRAS
jgi:hypothetical protein